MQITDCNHCCVELFKTGHVHGIKAAVSATIRNVAFIHLAHLMLGASFYLFRLNNRNGSIVRSKTEGFHRFIQCSGTLDVRIDRRKYWWMSTFNFHSNSYVAVQNNQRIQKIRLADTSCSV
jgi:hypothetical protein